MTNDRSLLADAATGALAGAVASTVMDQVTTFIYARQADHVTRRETRARGGKHAYEVAAQRIARVLGRELDDQQRKRAGTALHRATALGAGALYGVLRRRVPGVRLGVGLLFGTAFWLVVDEGMNAAFGFTPGPRAFPWQTHARGLAGHLAYGLTAELELRATDRVLC